jgi:hypothetical protein
MLDSNKNIPTRTVSTHVTSFSNANVPLGNMIESYVSAKLDTSCQCGEERTLIHLNQAQDIIVKSVHSVELREKGFPRSRNPGPRGKYLQALHYNGRLADFSESALEAASSGESRKDTVRKDTARSTSSVQWSKDVSYAQVLTGKCSTTKSP